MRFHGLLLGAFVACSSIAFAQTFEAAVGGGQSVFPGNTADIGTSTADPASGTYQMKDGFRFVLRMALSQGRFFGHEFGYAYSRTSLDTPATVTAAGTGLPGQTGIVTTIPAQNISLPSHQGFYDFLVYAMPEGKTSPSLRRRRRAVHRVFPAGIPVHQQSRNQVRHQLRRRYQSEDKEIPGAFGWTFGSTTWASPSACRMLQDAC